MSWLVLAVLKQALLGLVVVSLIFALATILGRIV